MMVRSSKSLHAYPTEEGPRYADCVHGRRSPFSLNNTWICDPCIRQIKCSWRYCLTALRIDVIVHALRIQVVCPQHLPPYAPSYCAWLIHIFLGFSGATGGSASNNEDITSNSLEHDQSLERLSTCLKQNCTYTYDTYLQVLGAVRLPMYHAKVFLEISHCDQPRILLGR